MKKLILFLGICLMFFTLPVLAAVETAADAGIGIEKYFITLAVMAGIVPVMTQFILSYVHTKFDQVASWVVALLLSTVGWIFQLGIFESMQWYWILIYGMSAGLAANGIFDIPFIQAILGLIQKRKNAV